MRISELEGQIEKYGVREVGDEKLLSYLAQYDIDNSTEVLDTALRCNTVRELVMKTNVSKGVAAKILASAELGRRMHERVTFQRIDASHISTVADYLYTIIKHEDKEHIVVLLLDTKKRVIKSEIVNTGTIDCACTTPRDVFREAVIMGAKSVIIAHNHPSGNCKPSSEDIEFTEAMVKSGKILDINLLDHIIIGDGDYYSFRKENDKIFD